MIDLFRYAESGNFGTEDDYEQTPMSLCMDGIDRNVDQCRWFQASRKLVSYGMRGRTVWALLDIFQPDLHIRELA
jgi:hypothetical protein